MSPLARYVGQFSPVTVSVRAMATLIAVALVFAAGFWAGGVSPRLELAELRTEAARSQARIAEHASRQLLDAQQRGDELTNQLHAANRAALLTQEKLDEALRRATTGRPCLHEPALRLLDGAPGIRLAVPAPAGGAAAADGTVAAAAGELVSSDTDVARWIGRAARQYDECRRRLGALIDWHQEAQ